MNVDEPKFVFFSDDSKLSKTKDFLIEEQSKTVELSWSNFSFTDEDRRGDPFCSERRLQ